MLDQDSPALYPDAVIEVRPFLSPDFSSMHVDVMVYFEVVDFQGLDVLKHAATRRIELTSGDMATDEPTIATILSKLKAAVMKSLRRELQPYNQGVTIEIE